MAKKQDGWVSAVVKGCLEGMGEFPEDAASMQLWLNANVRFLSHVPFTTLFPFCQLSQIAGHAKRCRRTPQFQLDADFPPEPHRPLSILTSLLHRISKKLTKQLGHVGGTSNYKPPPLPKGEVLGGLAGLLDTDAPSTCTPPLPASAPPPPSRRPRAVRRAQAPTRL
jgi:hypothetical protein